MGKKAVALSLSLSRSLSLSLRSLSSFGGRRFLPRAPESDASDGPVSTGERVTNLQTQRLSLCCVLNPGGLSISRSPALSLATLSLSHSLAGATASGHQPEDAAKERAVRGSRIAVRDRKTLRVLTRTCIRSRRSRGPPLFPECDRGSAILCLSRVTCPQTQTRRLNRRYDGLRHSDLLC